MNAQSGISHDLRRKSRQPARRLFTSHRCQAMYIAPLVVCKAAAFQDALRAARVDGCWRHRHAVDGRFKTISRNNGGRRAFRGASCPTQRAGSGRFAGNANKSTGAVAELSTGASVIDGGTGCDGRPCWPVTACSRV